MVLLKALARPLVVEKVPVTEDAVTISKVFPTVGVYPLARLTFSVPFRLAVPDTLS